MCGESFRCNFERGGYEAMEKRASPPVPEESGWRVPHPNVVLFDVRVGFHSDVPRGALSDVLVDSTTVRARHTFRPFRNVLHRPTLAVFAQSPSAA